MKTNTTNTNAPTANTVSPGTHIHLSLCISGDCRNSLPRRFHFDGSRKEDIVLEMNVLVQIGLKRRQCLI